MRFEDKYAPRSFEELIFESAEVKQKLKYYAENRRHKHLLLYGPPGTAKTTACVVIANERQPEGSECLDVLEASFVSMDLPSQLERVEAGWIAQQRLTGVSHPIAVINEIDQLKVEQQQRLRAFIDKSRFGFLFMTTNNLASVDQPLRDRCECIEVKSLTTETLLERAHAIVLAELGSVDRIAIAALRLRESIRIFILDDNKLCEPFLRPIYCYAGA